MRFHGLVFPQTSKGQGTLTIKLPTMLFNFVLILLIYYKYYTTAVSHNTVCIEMTSSAEYFSSLTLSQDGATFVFLNLLRVIIAL